ncbi:MAG: beta-propeller fold lactonase family protein [Chloroflexota bacterium]
MFKKLFQVAVIPSVILLMTSLTVSADGPYLEFLEHHQDDNGGITNFRPWGLAITPDQKYVYTASSDQDTIQIFSRNLTSGTLTYQGDIADFHPGSGTGIEGLNKPHAVAVSPDDRHVYVVGDDDNALVVFQRDEVGGVLMGSLTFIERHVDGEAGVDGLGSVYWVTVSPDGKHVYTTSVDDHAVSHFDRDAATGKLTFVETHKDETGGITKLAFPRQFTVSPDGKNVYVSSRSDFALVVFDRDIDTGNLRLRQEVVYDNAEGPFFGRVQDVVVSPDNRHVYIAGLSAVSLYHRDLDTGSLTHGRDYIWNEDDTSDNLRNAHGITVSPDGHSIFIVSDVNDTLFFFARDPRTGLLFLIEEQTDNLNGVEGLEDARDVIISPDMRNIYVTGNGDRAISVFRLTGDLPKIQHLSLPIIMQ